LFLVSINQAIKDLNFASAEFAAYARFRKDVIPIGGTVKSRNP
jgi:hypothetical protein